MIPNLIHPVPVTIQRVNRGVTVVDPVGREPIRQLWKAGQGPGTGTETETEAQVNWNQGFVRKPILSRGGDEEKTDGYLLFRVFDLLAAGIATENADGTYELGFVRGDKIVRIGRRRTNLFAVFFRDVAGYPDQGGCTLLEVDFSDRQPSSQPGT